MPLMQPEVQRILRKVGATKERATSLEENEGAGSTLSQRLSAAGLDLDTTLDNLANISNGSGNEGLRLRATETALKMHGALKESAQPTALPSFTIVINDSGASGSIREAGLLDSRGENPIFLPRQLLSKLGEAEPATN